jgi:hypothetical protein
MIWTFLSDQNLSWLLLGFFNLKRTCNIKYKDQKISLEQSIACFSLALSTILFCFSIFFELALCHKNLAGFVLLQGDQPSTLKILEELCQ